MTTTPVHEDLFHGIKSHFFPSIILDKAQQRRYATFGSQEARSMWIWDLGRFRQLPAVKLWQTRLYLTPEGLVLASRLSSRLGILIYNRPKNFGPFSGYITSNFGAFGANGIVSAINRV
jgi:hypothetical protein